MGEFMNLTKALADASRVRTLPALRQGGLCVGQITESFKFAPSTVSKPPSILFPARLVESRKVGRWIHHQLPGENVPVTAREALDWIGQSSGQRPAKSGRQQITKKCSN